MKYEEYEEVLVPDQYCIFVPKLNKYFKKIDKFRATVTIKGKGKPLGPSGNYKTYGLIIETSLHRIETKAIFKSEENAYEYAKELCEKLNFEIV